MKVYCSTNHKNDIVKDHLNITSLTSSGGIMAVIVTEDGGTSDPIFVDEEDLEKLSDHLLELVKRNKEVVDMNPVEFSKTPEEPYVEVFVQGDWIIDINYSTNLGVQTKTYRLDEEYVEEEAVREAYTRFIAELGVEYSNSILATSDIVIVNAGQLPTPSYRTIKLN